MSKDEAGDPRFGKVKERIVEHETVDRFDVGVEADTGNQSARAETEENDGIVASFDLSNTSDLAIDIVHARIESSIT